MPTGNRRPLYTDDGEAGSAPAATASSLPPAVAGAPLMALEAAPPRQAEQQAPSFSQPCTLKGLASAAYAGALGYFLGFVPAAIRFKGRQWGAIHAQGVGSASQLALMSGMYTAVHCICQRIRRVEDGWNRGLAGCSTGLVLGWRSGGPWSALQSCVGLGAISAVIDLGGGAVEAAEAALLADVQQLSGQLAAQQQQQQLACSPPALPALPALQQLAAALGERRAAAALAQQRWLAAPALSSQPQGAPVQQQQHPWQALQPALDVVQQVVAASPLMFLGACCQSGAGTPAVGGSVGQLVDACQLHQQPQPRRQQTRRRRQEQQQQ